MFNLENIKKDYEELLSQLSSPELLSDWEKFQELSKRKNCLEKIIEKDKEIQDIENKIAENKTIIAAGEDEELISLAQSEIIQLTERERKTKEELEQLLMDKGAKSASESKNAQNSAVIVEIRAGTGGEEAGLFAGDLFKMYSKYSQLQGWKQKVLDSRPTEIGGFKEIVFELNNGDVFSKMKYEAGVHRVQRIPTTEKSGRVHTSTASVAILPKPQKAQIQIKPGDLKVDVYKSSGPGGQYVNKRETAARITHLPTGLVVASQTERNLQQNKENAMSILEAKLFELKEKKEIEKQGGIKKLEKLPDAIFVLDMKKDELAVKEARMKGIKVIGIAHTNVDPNLADYPIPANDDAISSVKYILDRIREVILGAKPKIKTEK